MPGPALVTGMVLRARYYCQFLEQGSVNTIYYLVGTVTGTPPDALDAATTLDGLAAPYYKPLLANDAFYGGVGVNNQNMPPYYAQQFVTTNRGAGTGGTIALPRQVAGLASFYDGFANRNGRGRFYVAFPAEASNTGDGTPDSTYQSDMNQLIGRIAVPLLCTGFAGGTAVMAPVLLHRPTKKLPSVTPPPTFIRSFLVRPLWATQRRRGSYGRPNKNPIL